MKQLVITGFDTDFQFYRAMNRKNPEQLIHVKEPRDLRGIRPDALIKREAIVIDGRDMSGLTNKQYEDVIEAISQAEILNFKIIRIRI